MSGGNSSIVFPATLLVFQAICAFIWLAAGDYAIGTSGCGTTRGLWLWWWRRGMAAAARSRSRAPPPDSLMSSAYTFATDASGKASDSNPHSWTPTSLYR
jgi:hypothetical protein